MDPNLIHRTLVAFTLTALAIDVAVLGWVWWRRTARSWWTAVLCGAAALAILPFLCAKGRLDFFTARLIAHGLFGHGLAILVLSAPAVWRRARKTAVLSIVLAVCVAGVGIDAFWIEPTWLQVTHYRFSSPKIKRSVRLVVLADFQAEAIGPYERRVLQTVLDQEPDVILLAGDYLGLSGEECVEQANVLNGLLKELDFRAPEGVFAVMGNVDIYRPWPLIFHDLPVHLAMASQSIEVAGIQLTCLSVDHSFRNRTRIGNPSPERFHVVLGHSPNYALGEVDADLMLAGHTHGGQVQAPLLGPIFTGCQVPRAWASGLTELDEGRKLLVSRGTGMERGVAPRLRFCCRPEIVVIDLTPEATP